MAKQRTYTGGSGQMFVVTELLFRQCNAAIPMIDFGTDVFAFQDDREDVARIQGKSAQGKRYKKQPGYSIQFDIPMNQLEATDEPPLFYALVARVEDRWEDVIIISRRDLFALSNGSTRLGTVNLASGNLVLTIQFHEDRVECSGADLTRFKNAWTLLPTLNVNEPL